MSTNRAILFGVELSSGKKRKNNKSGSEEIGIEKNIQPREDMTLSLEELSRLAYTAGYQTVGTLTQKRVSPHPGNYLGKGKVQELKLVSHELEADIVICDDELSPAQVRNLEYELELTVKDRTGLIIEIFSKRASTREAKLQVELARLEYLLPRLRGKGEELSRLAGGIGTRGSGETKLEIERRHIERQVQRTKKKLKEVEKIRQEKRKKRTKENLPLVSLVGYTNSGKSTLLKKITDTTVIARDQLFSTLDPKLSQLELPNGIKCLLSDTVGFINKLPHDLVAAFKATLEEVKEADILLHIIDITSPEMQKEIEAVEDVLRSLEAHDKPVIKVYNKVDMLSNPDTTLYNSGDDSFLVSAIRGDGLDELLKGISKQLQDSWVEEQFFIPYGQENIAAMIYDKGEVIKEEYTENGFFVFVRLPEEEFNRFSKLLQD